MSEHLVMSEHHVGTSSESLLEGVECGFAFSVPDPRGAFPCQVGERLNDAAESIDESPIVVRKTDESLNIVHLLGRFPLLDGVDLRVVHLYGTSAYNVAKERDFRF